MQRTAPSKTVGVEIELPDFDEMFRRIQAVSPLARLAVQGGGSGEGGGFGKVDDTSEYLYDSIQSIMYKSYSNHAFILIIHVLSFLIFYTNSSARGAKMEEHCKEQTTDCFSD